MRSALFKLTLLLCFLGLGFYPFAANAQVTFQRTYGDDSTNSAYSVQQTSDGGFIVAGRTVSSDTGSFDVYLFKTDCNGILEWSKVYGGSNYDVGNSVKQTPDGGYIIVGSTSSFGTGVSDIYVLKTNGNGNLEWSKTYGGLSNDSGNDIYICSDGGFIVVGSTYSFGAGGYDVYLLKLDNNGNVTWSKVIGDTYSEKGYSVKQTPDSGYIILGSAYDNTASPDIYLLKTDQNGNLQWSKTYGVSPAIPYWGSNVIITQAGDYVIIGSISYGFSVSVMLLVKADSNGSLLWSRTYSFTGSGLNYAYDVISTNDKGYIFTGIIEINSNYDISLIKGDSMGSVQWSKTYGGNNWDLSYSLNQSSDGGYIIAGETRIGSLNEAYSDVYIVKTDSLGNSGCYESTSVAVNTSAVDTSSTFSVSYIDSSLSPSTVIDSGGTENTFTTDTLTFCATSSLCATGIAKRTIEMRVNLYPNPFNSTTTFEIRGIDKAQPLTFELYNIIGKRVKVISDITFPKFIISRANLPGGIYIYKINSNNGLIGAGKLVVN